MFFTINFARVVFPVPALPAKMKWGISLLAIQSAMRALIASLPMYCSKVCDLYFSIQRVCCFITYFLSNYIPNPAISNSSVFFLVSGFSFITHSVINNVTAAAAAFSKAQRTTLVGSIIPATKASTK